MKQLRVRPVHLLWYSIIWLAAGCGSEKPSAPTADALPAKPSAPTTAPVMAVARLAEYLPSHPDLPDIENQGADIEQSRVSLVTRIYKGISPLDQVIVMIRYEQGSAPRRDQRLQIYGGETARPIEVQGFPGVEADGIVFKYALVVGDVDVLFTTASGEQSPERIRAMAAQMDLAGLSKL